MSTAVYNDSHTLPDGKVFSMGPLCLEAPEAIFKPEIIGKQELGLHKVLSNVLNSCPSTRSKELASNVILSGGNASFRGLQERLTKEVQKLDSSMNLTVTLPIYPDFTAWRGGSIVCCLPNDNHIITMQEYIEEGLSVLDRKMFK